MIKKVSYECEHCGYVYNSAGEAQECEEACTEGKDRPLRMIPHSGEDFFNWLLDDACDMADDCNEECDECPFMRNDDRKLAEWLRDNPNSLKTFILRFADFLSGKKSWENAKVLD